MYSKNRDGPNTDLCPCGTPDWARVGSECSPLTTTSCVRFVRNACIHSFDFSRDSLMLSGVKITFRKSALFCRFFKQFKSTPVKLFTILLNKLNLNYF